MISHDRLRRDVLVVLIAALVALAAIGTFLALAGSFPRFGMGDDPYRVSALLPTSGTLAPGSRVTMAGAEVGRVDGVSRVGLGTKVELRITDDRVTPLPADSRFQLRLRTAVGENYIAVSPGRSRDPLSANAVVPLSRADDYVDADQVLSAFRGEARTRARQLLRSSGRVLGGRGPQLNETTKELGGLGVHFGEVVKTLHADRRQIARLVAHTASLTALAAERAGAIEALGEQGNVAVRAIADRDDELAGLLRSLPATLRQVRRTTRTAGAVSRAATPTLRQAALALRDVRPAVRSLRPAAQQGREVVRELSSTATPLRRTFNSLRNASRPLTRLVKPLRSVLCQANPLLKYVKPYAADLPEFFVGLGSAANSYDRLAHAVRLVPIIGENSAVGLPDDISQAAAKIVQAGLVGQVTGGLNYDPYPEPGTGGLRTSRGTAHVTGPADLKARGFKYPRVQAEC